MQQRAPSAGGLSQNQKLLAGAAVLGLGYYMYSRRQASRAACERSASPSEAAPAAGRVPARAPPAPPSLRHLPGCCSCQRTNFVATKASLSFPYLFAARPVTWVTLPAGRARPRAVPSRLPAKR